MQVLKFYSITKFTLAQVSTPNFIIFLHPWLTCGLQIFLNIFHNTWRATNFINLSFENYYTYGS